MMQAAPSGACAFSAFLIGGVIGLWWKLQGRGTMAPPQSSLAAESIASLETLLQRLERTVRSNSASIDDARIARTVDAANELLQEALAAAAGEEGSLSEESSIRLDPAIFPRVQGQLAVPGISACLIDLDGTIYNPHGTISGADDFYAFLCRRQIPYVFLSNTGAKGAAGVRDKLQRIGDFYLSADPPPESKILTAAEAQAAYMLATVPFGAKIFAIAGGAEPSFWMELLEREAERTGVAELVASWEVHTQLSESLAKEWAVAAAAHQRSGQAAVFVVLFSDGSITAAVDPQSGELGHADWHVPQSLEPSVLATGSPKLTLPLYPPFVITGHSTSSRRHLTVSKPITPHVGVAPGCYLSLPQPSPPLCTLATSAPLLIARRRPTLCSLAISSHAHSHAHSLAIL